MKQQECIVKKLGGENAAEITLSTQNIITDAEKTCKQIIVLSAMRSPSFNSTDTLIELAGLLEKGSSYQKIETLLGTIESFHTGLIAEKIGEDSILIEYITKKFTCLRQDIESYMSQKGRAQRPQKDNDYTITGKSGEMLSLLAFGEELSAELFLQNISLNLGATKQVKYVNISHICAQSTIKDIHSKEGFLTLSKILQQKYLQELEVYDILIFPGYIGDFPGGIEGAIGRGYTDATAALCAIGAHALGYSTTLEIQKSVPGVLSADPRVLLRPNDAQVIPVLDYISAREITGDGGAHAKLLHSQAMRAEVQESGIIIRLFDPFSESTGSYIVPKLEEKHSEGQEALFIGGRRNIMFFSISSGKMFESGILAKIFTIVQDFFSVDIISASETEVSFTIDEGQSEKSKDIDDMVSKLRLELDIFENSEMEFIELRKNKALIFCIGPYMRNKVGTMAKASQILADNNINIEIASQGRLQRAIVFGVDGEDMEKAVNVLHNSFIS